MNQLNVHTKVYSQAHTFINEQHKCQLDHKQSYADLATVCRV